MLHSYTCIIPLNPHIDEKSDTRPIQKHSKLRLSKQPPHHSGAHKPWRASPQLRPLNQAPLPLQLFTQNLSSRRQSNQLIRYLSASKYIPVATASFSCKEVLLEHSFDANTSWYGACLPLDICQWQLLNFPPWNCNWNILLILLLFNATLYSSQLSLLAFLPMLGLCLRFILHSIHPPLPESSAS